jgi:hypothetical protein
MGGIMETVAGFGLFAKLTGNVVFTFGNFPGGAKIVLHRTRDGIHGKKYSVHRPSGFSHRIPANIPHAVGFICRMVITGNLTANAMNSADKTFHRMRNIDFHAVNVIHHALVSTKCTVGIVDRAVGVDRCLQTSNLENFRSE